ncbi:MAG: ParB/RepB/Spo0J family partition protein [Candidatus Omnitrophota bacterium]
MERRALGKGLNALIPEVEEHIGQTEGMITVGINEIFPSKYQPRIEFDEEKLEELVRSIKEKGVVQPLLVRPKDVVSGTAGRYELIAGERRLRAAKKAGLVQIPVILKSVDDTELLQLSLVENLQRENLNAIEEAAAYERLINEFNFTQEEVARVMGKNRSTITNLLRVLRLPEVIKEQITQNKINLGHAKVLLALENTAEQIQISQKIIKDDLSVRQTEAIVYKLTTPDEAKSKKPREIDPNVQEIERKLQQVLGTKVRIVSRRKRGKIEIDYYSLSDLDRILQILQK